MQDRRQSLRARARERVKARSKNVRPFLVHIFTACGAGCALMAMLAAAHGRWVAMFVWLGVALVIDGVDGTLARRFRVAEILPRWSGSSLDLVVDFTTYVFVPAFALGDQRSASTACRDAARARDRHHQCAVFCRRRDENVGKLFSRISGIVERSRFPSVRIEAAALGGRLRRRGIGNSDLHAAAGAASVPGGAVPNF